jgi:hypothetical protein
MQKLHLKMRKLLNPDLRVPLYGRRALRQPEHVSFEEASPGYGTIPI